MSITRYSSYNLAGMVLPMLVAIFTVPLYLNVIGIERYGVLSLCWLLLGYMGFLEIGMGPALQQKVATLRNASPVERSQVFWTALYLNLAAGLLGSVAVYWGAALYFSTLDTDAVVKAEISGALPWLAATFPVVMLSSILVGALKGREEFLAANAISAFSSISMAILPLVVAAQVEPRLDLLVATSMGARMVGVVLLCIACFRVIPIRKPSLPEKAHLKALLSFGGWISLTSILTPLASSVDRFAIGSVIGSAAVAVYVVPFNLVSRAKLIPHALASALFPRFAAVDTSRQHKLELDALAATAVIMTPVILVAMVLIGPFLHLWVGESLARQSAPVAYLLLAGWWANSLARVSLARVQGSGRPKLVAKLLLWELPFYAIALYFLMRSMGVMGAAIAWSVRAAIDPFVLAAFNGALGSLARISWFPALVVVSALLVALVTEYDSPSRLFLLAIAGCGIGWAWRAMPPVVSRPVLAAIEKVAVLARFRS